MYCVQLWTVYVLNHSTIFGRKKNYSRVLCIYNDEITVQSLLVCSYAPWCWNYWFSIHSIVAERRTMRTSVKVMQIAKWNNYAILITVLVREYRQRQSNVKEWWIQLTQLNLTNWGCYNTYGPMNNVKVLEYARIMMEFILYCMSSNGICRIDDGLCRWIEQEDQGRYTCTHNRDSAHFHLGNPTWPRRHTANPSLTCPDIGTLHTTPSIIEARPLHTI